MQIAGIIKLENCSILYYTKQNECIYYITDNSVHNGYFLRIVLCQESDLYSQCVRVENPLSNNFNERNRTRILHESLSVMSYR